MLYYTLIAALVDTLLYTKLLHFYLHGRGTAMQMYLTVKVFTRQADSKLVSVSGNPTYCNVANKSCTNFCISRIGIQANI